MPPPSYATTTFPMASASTTARQKVSSVNEGMTTCQPSSPAEFEQKHVRPHQHTAEPRASRRGGLVLQVEGSNQLHFAIVLLFL
eukprot:755815-Hanusia_phi.AAC.10